MIARALRVLALLGVCVVLAHAPVTGRLIKPQIIVGPLIVLAIPAWRQGHLQRYVTGLLASTAVQRSDVA